VPHGQADGGVKCEVYVERIALRDGSVNSAAKADGVFARGQEVQEMN
jgi:hypothetical protein